MVQCPILRQVQRRRDCTILWMCLSAIHYIAACDVIVTDWPRGLTIRKLSLSTAASLLLATMYMYILPFTAGTLT